MKTLFVLVCALLLLAGCATPVESGVAIDPLVIDQFVKGTTTHEQVVAVMGQPISVMFVADGQRNEVWFHTRVSTHGVYFPPVYVTRTQQFSALFKNDVLIDWALTEKKTPVDPRLPGKD